MPVSDYNSVAPIIHEVMRLKPTGIVELGIGFGKYGVLCREALEATEGRCSPSEWKVTINGVEGHKPYSNPCWDVYSHIIIGDFREMYEKIVGWPLVLMVDSLEHVDEVEAQAILEFLVRNNDRVIVSVPVGTCPQEGVFDNPLEKHRSTWYKHSFDKYASHRHIIHEGVCVVASIKGIKE